MRLETRSPVAGDDGAPGLDGAHGQATNRNLAETPLPVTLRTYQRAAVDAVAAALRGGASPLVVAPCGSGKSLMVAESARRAVRVVSDPSKPDAVEPVWEREVAHA